MACRPTEYWYISISLHPLLKWEVLEKIKGSDYILRFLRNITEVRAFLLLVFWVLYKQQMPVVKGVSMSWVFFQGIFLLK